MVDIFTLPIYYISFKKSSKLEDQVESKGFQKPTQFNAIDGRLFDLDTLLYNNIITIRGYNDIKYGRKTHEGLPTLGAVGCMYSHYALWNKCIENDYPYIIILEDDVIVKTITNSKLLRIQEALAKENSIFLGTDYHTPDPNKLVVWGLHFYIMSNDACKIAVKDAFPIDIQADWYLVHLHNIKKVNITAFKTALQGTHPSSIQDNFRAAPCTIANDHSRKIMVITFLVLITLFLIITLLYKKYYKCKKTCSVPCEPCKPCAPCKPHKSRKLGIN